MDRTEVKPDHFYEHYKGAVYRVWHLCTLEADGSDMVVYNQRGGRTWVRPLTEFCEKFKPIDGERARDLIEQWT